MATTAWVMLQAGRYRREINGFILECNRHGKLWWWTCWREEDFYQSGTKKTRRQGKTNATLAMNNHLKKLKS